MSRRMSNAPSVSFGTMTMSPVRLPKEASISRAKVTGSLSLTTRVLESVAVIPISGA